MTVSVSERAERNRKSAAASRARKAAELSKLRAMVAALRARVEELEKASEQLMSMFCLEFLDKPLCADTTARDPSNRVSQVPQCVECKPMSASRVPAL